MDTPPPPPHTHTLTHNVLWFCARHNTGCMNFCFKYMYMYFTFVFEGCNELIIQMNSLTYIALSLSHKVQYKRCIHSLWTLCHQQPTSDRCRRRLSTLLKENNTILKKSQDSDHGLGYQCVRFCSNQTDGELTKLQKIGSHLIQ